MPTVIPVKFTYAARDLWFDPQDTGAVEADHVICVTERGTEIGIVTADAHEVSDEELRSMIGEATLKPISRVATDDDLDRADRLADRGDEAMPVFRRLVAESGLDMKPVGVEFLFGGEKAVCYFSADERVDFRQLVRDLARELHERIDMRQIGVREEAAIVGGFAHCGQELCCARFGHQFEPVSIRMAKEQDLPLNSTKISGACGRLMCCLRYEFEAYRDFKGRAPKRNAVIETPLGKAKIIEYDTPKEQLTLRLENGKQLRVALADMQASEAAVKKSEELHCPCRPDTAPREALERLATPEVQLALAELDREMGLVPDEQPDQSDIFVQPARKRERSSGSQDESAQRDAAKVEQQDGTGSTRSRRRRKKHVAEGETHRQQEVRVSRRAGAAAAEDATEQPAQAKATHRRRRHHAAEGEPQVQAEPRQEAKEPAKAAPARRSRRRPGDKGGRPASETQPRQGQQQEARTGASASAGQQDGAAPKRRRRRRGGRGKGQGEGQSQAPSAE